MEAQSDTIKIHFKEVLGEMRENRSDGYVCYLGCGDGFHNVCIYPNSTNCLH